MTEVHAWADAARRKEQHEGDEKEVERPKEGRAQAAFLIKSSAVSAPAFTALSNDDCRVHVREWVT